MTIDELEDAIGKQTLLDRKRIAEPGGRERYLGLLVDYKLLELEAERRGYREHPLVIEAGKRAAIDRMIERDVSVRPSAIPAEDVAASYAADQARWSRAELRRASEIVLASEAEARALIAELKAADRARFARVAGERSTDADGARQGGELGYFDRSGKLAAHAESAPKVAAPIAEAVFTLEHVGDIRAQPLALGGSFHVLMLTGVMPAMVRPLAKAERTIRDSLAEARSQRALEELERALAARTPPEIHAERLQPIALDPAPAPDAPQGFPAAPKDPRAPPKRMAPDEY